ncbi:hypothetical protein MRX96_012948 [Rhipicephalus microplus]
MRVRPQVKVYEQAEDEESLSVRYVHDVPGESAVNEERDGHVHDDNEELHNLQRREVLLPPQVLLHAGSEAGEEVIGVHDGMHEDVEREAECRLTLGSEAGVEPDVDDHDGVVDDMELGHLIELLAQNEEDGVQEIGVSPGDENPAVLVKLEVMLWGLSGQALAQQAVRSSGQVRGNENHKDGDDVHDDQGDVVHADDVCDLKWFPVLHPSRTGNLDEVQVGDQHQRDEKWI